MRFFDFVLAVLTLALPAFSQHILVTSGSGGSGLVGVANTRTGKTGTYLQTGTTAPESVAVSHDGTHVYASVAGLIDYINVSTGAIDAQISLTGDSQSLVISPDGDRLFASYEGNGGVLVIATIDTASNQIMATAALANFANVVYAGTFAFSADGKRLYAGFQIQSLVELNAQTGALIGTITLPYTVYGIAIAKTGNVLVVSTVLNNQGTLVVLDVTTFQQIGQIALAAGTCLQSVAVDRAGKFAYAISSEGCDVGAATSVSKFDISALHLVTSVLTAAPASQLILSPGENALYVGEANSIAVLTTQSLKSVDRYAQIGRVSGIALSNDGLQIYVANSTISEAQYAGLGAFPSGVGLAVGPTNFRVPSVTTSRDGILSFVNSGAAATVTVIDNRSKSVLGYLPMAIDPNLLAVGSSAGPLFAAGVALFGPSHLAKVDPKTGNLLAEITVPGYSPSAMGVSPDDSRLWVLSMNNGLVSVYDTGTLALAGSFAAVSPSALTFSSDGLHCYIASSQNNTGVLDVNTQTFQINRTLAPLDVTFWVSLSPDQQTLYTLSNQSIYALNLTDGSIVTSVYVGRNPNLAALATDGSEIYVSNKSGYLTIYDTASAKVVRTEYVNTGVDGLSATKF